MGDINQLFKGFETSSRPNASTYAKASVDRQSGQMGYET